MSFSTPTSKLSVLHTNLMPEGQDAIQIKDSISSQETIVADLDSKIQELQAQREVALKSLAIDLALLAPIRRLAPELLATIFEYCLPAKSARRDISDTFKHRTTLRTLSSRCTYNEAPFVMLHVCHRWHDIAQQTPRLWTNVSICCKRSIAYASRSLRNSRSLPLNVYIYNMQHCDQCCEPWGKLIEYRPPNPPPPPHLLGRTEPIDPVTPPFAEALKDDPKFRELLVNKLAFASSLNFAGSLDVLLTLIPPTRLDLLRELVIDCISTTPEVPVFSLLKAPSLCVLELHEAANMLAYIEPSNTLRYLTLTAIATEIPSGPLYEFLRSCPGIEELVFHCDNINRRFMAPRESENPIHLSALRRLEIDSDTGTELIGLLHAPNVQQASFHYSPDDWLLVQAFFSRARESLVHLAFSAFSPTSFLLSKLIDALPSVELLAFESCDTGGEIWEYLTPDEGTLPDCLKCPKLKHLEMSRTPVSEEFIEFVSRRAENYSQDGARREGGGYFFEIKLQECMISGPVVKALWDILDQGDGVLITGLPPVVNDPAYSDDRWQPGNIGSANDDWEVGLTALPWGLLDEL